MQFQPKTQEQIDSENLCEEGTFPFTIKTAEEARDKNGNGFFKLKLFVHDHDRDWHVYDNVSPVWMAHKLLHLCEGVGLGAKYQQGNLSVDDLIDRQGHCEVSMKDAQKGFAAQNIITDYVVREKNGVAAGPGDARLNPQSKPKTEPGKTGQRPEDDDVPFN